MFTSCDFSIVKRGLQTYWNVTISLEQVWYLYQQLQEIY
jgi:hypothetical protein